LRIIDIEIDPSDDNLIYFSTSGNVVQDNFHPAKIYRSVNGGVLFSDVTPLQSGNPIHSRRILIETSEAYSDHIFAVIDNAVGENFFYFNDNKANLK